MQRPDSIQASPLPHLSDQEWSKWRESHPPMAGEDPTATPESAATPPEGTTETPTAPAPEAGTSGSDAATPAEAAIAPFNIADVPEEYREHVERYNRQIQGAFTRKTQELAAERTSIADAIALQEALGSDDTRDEAIRKLLVDNGWDIEGDEPVTAATATTETTTPAPADDPVAQRIAALEADAAARREADERQAQDDYAAAVSDAVNTGIEGYRTAEGLKTVSDAERGAITAIARALAPIEVDGLRLPNMEAAIELHKAQQAEALQRYLASKDVPTPELAGVAGKTAFDPRDDKQRLAKAQAIAGRHLG